jgi:dihydrofolate reductase
MKIYKNMSIIVAIAKNNAIGKDNKLLWHIPEDLKRFKELTLNKKIIMGRNTYLSLPKRPLPGRENIIISNIEDDSNSVLFKDINLISNNNDIFHICESTNDEVFIICGAFLYNEMINYANKLYVTFIHKEFEADTFFPDINKTWKSVYLSNTFFSEKEKISFNYITYKRKNE